MSSKLDARPTTNRQKIKLAFEERFGHEKNTAFLILRTDVEQLWEPFLVKVEKRHLKINAKFDTEKISGNVTIEAKRELKMMPKWSHKL